METDATATPAASAPPSINGEAVTSADANEWRWPGHASPPEGEGEGGGGAPPLTRRYSDSETVVAAAADGPEFGAAGHETPLDVTSIRPSHSGSSLFTLGASAAAGAGGPAPRPQRAMRVTHPNARGGPQRRAAAPPARAGSKTMARPASRGRLGAELAPLATKPHKARGAPPLTTRAALRPVAASAAPAAPPSRPAAAPHSRFPSKLPGFATKAGPEASRLAHFVPAHKLDPKQIKEVIRRWYRVDSAGKVSIINAGKTELTQSLGVHSRDLRILDANSGGSSYPSCILCRDRALVINLEYIQVIVTTDTTLVLNAERATDLVKSFVDDLQARLALRAAAFDADAEATGSRRANGADGGREERERRQAEAAAAMPGSAREAQEQGIPYELQVLEVCLDHVATTMSERVRALETDSTAALERLALRVTAGHLEHVRRVKNHMVRLTTRVETIRVLLEKYLGDDDDLAELHLTGSRLVEEQNAEKARQREVRRQERLARFAAKRARKLAGNPLASEPSSVSNSTFTLSEEDTGWLSSQAEMVLEPYFMSFDNTWNRLQAVGEFIDDTEDYVNITLDSHRNQLIQVDLLLTAASFCVGLVTLIAGIFGMNLRSDLEDDGSAFTLVATLSCVLAVALLAMFVMLMRQKQLAFV